MDLTQSFISIAETAAKQQVRQHTPTSSSDTHTELLSNLVVQADTQIQGYGDTPEIEVLGMNATWYQNKSKPRILNGKFNRLI